MKDKYFTFVNQGIYIFEEKDLPPSQRQRNTTGKYIELELSADKFTEFCNAINQKTINTNVLAVIHDEGIVTNRDQLALRKKLIKTLNKLNYINITFNLSNSTLPIYNSLMNKLDWRHKPNTTINMTIDRNPVGENTHSWNLNEAMGTVNIPEEKLIWLPDNEFTRLNGIVNKKTLEDTEKLKKVLLYLDNYLRETYYIDKMNNYDKVQLIYKFLNMHIRHAKRYIETINEKETLKPDIPSYILEPYGTWFNKEGVSEGQARLMTILLNNPFINIDASTIKGQTPFGERTWVGIVLEDKLYQCCTTVHGPFKNLNKLGYTIEEDQIYPSIYEPAYLKDTEISKIKNRIKCLTK